MAAPDDNTGNGAGGMLNGHGVGTSMAAIFVGMGLVVAFVASDGAIFGLNFSSATDNGAPVAENDVGNAGIVSEDVFDERPEEESAAPPDTESNAASIRSELSAGLS
jgi:hypothetical protein